MATKTITVTEDAYEALRALKGQHESFSETILRVARRRSLKEFVGCLSRESADKLEEAVKESRRKHTEEHNRRVAAIAKALGQQ